MYIPDALAVGIIVGFLVMAYNHDKNEERKADQNSYTYDDEDEDEI